MASTDTPRRSIGSPDAPGHTRSLLEADSPTSGAPSGTSSPPEAAGRYAIAGEIARGGMGVVYRATDTVLGREVAVKVLQGHHDVASGAARRFADEARIAAQLQHPGIPPVHDLGALPDGRPFLAMKLIKGDTLADLLRQRPDASAERGRFVAVFEQICQALAYAHAHEVIHRDLKPANVMVGSFGEVQVMDWGLAKVLSRERERVLSDPNATVGATAVVSVRDSADQFTQAGSVLGTPAYMPPEQAIGAVDQIDRRSDVFGLGAILTAILCGRPPFDADTAETSRQMAAKGKIQECFTRLDGSGADPELVLLCKRCLAPDKEDRPPDAGEVAKAVAELRAAADERARQAELQRVRMEGEKTAADLRVAAQRRRARFRMGLAAAVGLLFVAACVLAWYEAGWRGRNAEAVAGLLEQTETALKAGDAAKAAVLLEAADQRAAEGGAGEWAERRAALATDLALLGELNAAERFQWTNAADHKLPDLSEVASRYRAALALFGADPDATDPDPVAHRVAGSAVRDRLVTALDWVLWEERSPRVRSTLQTADPEPLRDAIRDAAAAGGGPRLVELAKRPELADHPPRFVTVLANDSSLSLEQRRGLLEAAIRRQPRDLALLLTMEYTYSTDRGKVEERRERADERLRWAQAAVAAAPDNPLPRLSLGLALSDLGNLRAAIAEYQKALDIDPDLAVAHSNLGWVLQRSGELDAAIKCYQKSIHLNDKDPVVHVNLGWALDQKGKYDEAISCYKAALDKDPNYALAHNDLGVALNKKGDFDGAIASFREALRLDPKNSFATVNLAAVERLRGLPRRLPGVLAGTDRPATPTEAFSFAELCAHRSQRRYAAAVALCAQAFDTDSSLAETMLPANQTHRYDAACFAARAARGDGLDAPADPARRSALRTKALTWLRADLDYWQKLAASSSAAEREKVAAALSYWFSDSDLSATRPGTPRVDMPAAEQAAWDALWTEVQAIISGGHKATMSKARR
jgi:tetratricopeptide (TPR) repeat protein/tRNA A-37 threonylcarbamoyl transferase component Bud32